MTDPQQPSPVPPPTTPAGYPAPPVAPPGFQPPYPQSGTPAYQAPPGAFAGPAGGYAAPYPPTGPPAGRPTLGRIALLLSLVATVVLTIVGAVFAWQIGQGIGTSTDLTTLENDLRGGALALLTPVRDLVLWAEISFWAATVLGIWALVQGIIAIAKRRGRGSGVAAIVIAAVGPFVYLFVVYFALVVALGTSVNPS